MPGLLWLWNRFNVLQAAGAATIALAPSVVRAPSLQVDGVATVTLVAPGEATPLSVAGLATAVLTPNVKHAPTLTAPGQATVTLVATKLGGTVIPGRPPNKRFSVQPASADPRVSIRAHSDAPQAAEVGIRWPAPLGRVRGHDTSANAVEVKGPLPLRGDATIRGRAEPPIVGTEDEDLLLLAALLLND